MLNNISIIFTSHMKKTKMPGIIMLKNIFFLKTAPSVFISVPECTIIFCCAVVRLCGCAVVRLCGWLLSNRKTA
jgi:hypothetical protein